HGTWVCGKRGKPGVFVRLKEGDTDQDWGPTDEKDDTCLLDDDMEGLEWLGLANKIYQLA
ncbi:hypothetical protein Tco_0205588, partial [Tanacetum coccineum]